MPDTLPDLICPRCNQPLNQVRMSYGVFWACNSCGGRAINIELLRRTFTPESINPLWLHAIRGEGQSVCRCPSCRHLMLEVQLSDDAPLKVDVCKVCQFVWFDAHEIDTLVPRPAKPKARETIARIKVQELAERARLPDADSAPPLEWWKAIADFLGMRM
jgi:Zn-finger nucleic acid-binding protein